MTADRRPGQPLAALGLIVGAWILARVVLWQAPMPIGQALAMPEPAPRSRVALEAYEDKIEAPEADGAQISRLVVDAALAELTALPFGRRSIAPSVKAAPVPAVPRAAVATAPAELAGWRAGPVQQPAARSVPPPTRGPKPSGRPASVRWSGGGWLLLRGGAAGALAAGPGVARYGGSQAGAVVRYSLGPGDRRPAFYARATTAVGRAAERELAIGLSARPLAAVPVRAQLEVRAMQSAGRLRFHPAATAFSELSPIDLPAGLRAEAYLQAGYVAGDFATPFVGGGLRVDRALADLGGTRLRAGAGAWGGAQKGASALDVGPGVTLETDLAGMPARVALDYRVRVAGGAEPRSGLALTLSTGF